MVDAGKSRTAGSLATVFIGREREMSLLRAECDHSLAGRGRLVLLAGEPGIGKTRTAEQLSVYATAAGAEVIWGRCYEGEGAPAFWPWVQIVRAYAQPRSAETLRDGMSVGAAAIAEAFPELRDRLPDLPPAPTLPPERARFRLFDSVVTFLATTTKHQPLVLILDDIHWGDKASLLLLEFVARQMSALRLMILASYRESELMRDHALLPTLAELARQPLTRRITLSGLHAADIADYIALVSGHAASAALVTAVAKQTDGNPFFVGEVLRLLSAEGWLEAAGQAAAYSIGIPPGVRAVILQRVKRLSNVCNQLLTIAAVIGREFDLQVLDATVQRAKGEVGSPSPQQCPVEPDSPAPVTAGAGAVADMLDEAVAAGVVGEVAGRPGRYAFSHALIRETLYGELNATRRARLHSCIGHVLEERYREHTTGTHLAELAHHYGEAAEVGYEREIAIDYALRAAAEATPRHAYEHAVQQYERVLRLLESNVQTDAVRQCETLLILGDAQMRAGAVVDAKGTSVRAATLARRLGRSDLFARAALGFGWEFEIGVAGAERVGLLKEALRALPPDDSVPRTQVMARLAMALGSDPLAADCRELLGTQAIDMARRLGDGGTLAFALHARQFALWTPGNAERRVPVSRELLELAERAVDPELALQSRQWLVTDLLELGDLAAADHEISAHGRIAAELCQPRYLWFAATWKAMRALLSGRLSEVECLAEEALVVGRRAEPENAALAYAALLFFLRREQGRLDELVDVFVAYARGEAFASAWRSGLAFIYSELERRTEAAAELEASGALLRRSASDPGWLSSMIVLAEVCAFLEDAESASIVYERLQPFARFNVMVGLGVACLGSTARALGIAAATMRQWTDAERHFADALAMHARLQSPPLAARTRYDVARMLLTRDWRGDRATALGELDLALATAEQLGLAGLAGRARALRARAAGEPAPATDAVSVPAGDSDQPARARAQRAQVEMNRGHPGAAETHVLRHEGDVWTVAFDGRTFRLKDTKGIQYLALLLRHQGRELHAMDIAAGPAPPADRHGTCEWTADATRRKTGMHIGVFGSIGPALDARAHAAYKQRVEELRDEIAEAERLNDRGRLASAKREKTQVERELARAFGSSRGARPVASAAERARLNVTRALKAVLANITHRNPSLGEHLRLAVKTGTFCSYAPDPAAKVEWHVS